MADKDSNDEVLGAFLDFVMEAGIEPCDHQEEAILELFGGRNVILNTPTGSGKSLVAMAAVPGGMPESTFYYTVPIKALANEKFLSLCKTFGPDKVNGHGRRDGESRCAGDLLHCGNPFRSALRKELRPRWMMSSWTSSTITRTGTVA